GTTDGGGGIFIAAGNAEIRDNQIYSNTATGTSYGGGVFVLGSSPQILDNVIYGNAAVVGAGRGGGLYIASSASSASVRGNVIRDNEANLRGGGIFVASGSATIEENQVYRNKTISGGAQDGGGGIYVDSGSPIIRANEIYQNTIEPGSSGGGIYVGFASGSIIERNTIYNNSGGYRGGGIYVRQNNQLIRNNLVYSNTATSYGAGIVFWWGDSIVENNTVYANIGDGMYNEGSGSPIIRNNIVISNTGTGIRRKTGTLVVYYNDVIGNAKDYSAVISTTTDISADPLFVNPGVDFRLQAGSPAIDAADPNNYSDDDHRGYARPFGARADIGAYEFYTGTCFSQVEGAAPIYATVQEAVNAASSGGGVKAAGRCEGAYAHLGTISQTVYISQPLTLSGGYTLSNWLSPTVPTTLDAQGKGRVIYITGTGVVTVERFIIRGGAAITGGGIYVAAPLSPTVQNVIFYSNTADFGGGFGSAGGVPRLDNNTFVTNTAVYSGGAIYFGAGLPLVRNTIVVSNAAAAGGGIFATPVATPSLAYNDVWRNVGGDYAGNASAGLTDFSLDPRFVDSAAANFHLQSDSPAIHAADPQTTLVWDFEGDPRPLGRGYDTGADESTAYPDLSFAPDLLDGGIPDQQITYTHFLTNVGTITDTFDLTHTLTVSGTAGWVVNDYTPVFTLTAGKRAALTITVRVPGDAVSGTYAVVVLTATSRTNGDIYDTAQNTSIANLNPGSQFTPRYAQNVNPGAVFTYVHTLTNTGNAAETYNITWSSSRGWAKAVTPTLITELDPQMTATVWVSMVVPATMPGGITETTILTVAGDFNTQSVVTDTTRVNYTTGDRYVATTGDDTLNNCLVSDAPCGTLVYAMDQATSGSTVKVAAGTYNEHDIIVNKDVILRGGYTVDDWTTFNPWKHQTIIDAQRNGRIFYIFGDPTIEGFWLQNGATDGSGGAVYVGFGSPVLNGNFFVDNTAGVNGGGFYAANGSPDLWNNVFYDNVAAGDGGGVYVAGGNTRIWHNTIYSNTAEKGGGVALAGGSLAVSNTIVVSNSATTGGGFYRAGGSSTLDYNDTWGNVNGDYVGLSAGSNSTSTNPLFVDPASADLHLQAASPLIDIGDGTSLINDMDGQPRTMGGGADIGADEYLRAGVELAPPFTSQGLPRHVALYTHTLTNTGNYTDTFVLSAQSNQGWVVTVPVTVEIGAGLNITVLAEVAIPAAAISGTVDTTEITATSSLAPSVSGVVTDTTTVALKHDVSLKPAYTGFADSNPSGVVPEYYLHTLTTEGNYTDTFNLIGVSGQGWGVGINPSIVTLGAGEKITVSVAVTVPAVPTDTVLVDITFITATVEVYTSAFAVITDTTYVNVRPGLVLAPDRTGSGKPGTSVFYSLILTNTGNYTDTIEFDAFSSEDWPTTSVADMDLGPGLSTIVLYEVKIPGSTLSNTVDIGSLIASSSQFGVADSAMVSTTVEQAPGVTLQRKWPNASGWCVIAPYSGLPYLFELSNTGNYTDTFDIGAQSAQGWSVTFPLDVTVGPELDTNVWVYLDVPTTTAQIVDTLTVSATSRADNSVTGLASYFTKVNWDVGVSLDPNYNGTVIVEDSIVYTHIVTNTGVDFNIIQFSSQDSQGWPVNITPSQASLNPGDSAMVTVVISVPLDEVNVTDVTVITATTTIDCLARAIAVDVTSVTRPRVTLGPNYVQDVAPGNVFTYVHSLENTGAIDDSYVITYAQAADWSVTVTPTLVSSILPGVTMPVRVAVMPPPGTLAGITNVVTVTAISQRSAAIYDIAVNTTTVPYLPSALLTPARSGSAEPGGIVTYTHALTNTGNLTDTFMLAPHPGAFAYASVSPGSVILAPGETYTNIQVAVYILPYAPRGSTESTQLIAVFSKTQVVVIDNTFVNTIASTRYVAPNGFDTNNNCTDLNFAPCATVQHAIDQAISGDMILVAQGVYTGTTSKLVVAAGTADDPFMVDAARTAKLETALAAYAYTETTTSTLSAADMALIDAASTITQLVYLDKSLTLWGGFSTTDWETSKPEERPTVLDAGGQGRGIYVTAVTSTMGITPTIRGFHIRNGAVNGDGAGVYVEPGAVPIIAQNRIYSNTASGSGSEGGGIYYGGAIGDVRLWNNLFYHNHADDLGGGLYNSGGNATVWNSTFYSNTAGTGGGIYIASGMPGISNTIVVDNAGTGIYNASGAPALAYNDVWGNTPVDYSGVISAGVGSLSMDPLFLNPSGGDFRLRTDSPAVNAGGPLAVFPDLDLAGNQRPLEGRHDMGAYENGITSLKASVGAAVSGQVVTYTITIANTGSQVWLGATLTDTLHPYLDYAGSLLYSAGSGQYITASRTIDWTGPVYTSTPTLITFTARITDWIASGTVITNLAWVNYAGTNVVSTTVSASSGVRYVSTTGFDTGNGCKSPVQPCQTVQRAVAQALVNDEVKVSAGVYTDTLNAGQVVSVSKSITLTGGYAPGTWAYAPETYQTTLDGQNAGHGVVVTGPVTVTLAGFHVIQNVDGIHVTGGSLTLKRTQVYSSTGHGVAVESGSYTLINNLIVHNAGAGLWTNKSTGVLNHNTFAGNTLAGAWVDRTASFTNTIFYNHTVGISVTTGSTATLSHSV
ncbi:MAG: right-handed parallel beta-helix repeat-containing protein, partial [Anaerolineales bacterium]